MRKKMEKLDIRPERLQLEWVSAAEGTRFAEIMRRVEDLRRTVSKSEIEQTMTMLAERNKGGHCVAQNNRCQAG
jgi:heterodisulfide reductase subunit A